MPLSIYALYYLNNDNTKSYFYVGQTRNILRRMRQHEYLSLHGHEDKYHKIRELKSKGILFSYDVLNEIPEGDYALDHEDWYFISLTRRGHRLTNMRHGEELKSTLSKQIQSPSIRTVADVTQHRKYCEYVASRKLRHRTRRRGIEEALDAGIRNVEKEERLPTIIKKILLKDGFTSVPKRFSIQEFYGLCRRMRKIHALTDSLLASHPMNPISRRVSQIDQTV